MTRDKFSSDMDATKSAQRIHIAIAIAALSNKPPGQSLPSYLLDLKTRFPLLDEGVIRSPRSSYREEEGGWRKRVLALEEENEALKLRAQKQELEVRALKAGVDESSVDQESSQAPKKKRKIVQSTSNVVSDRIDLRAVIKDIQSGPRLPALKDSLDVLASFRTLKLSDTNQFEPESEMDQEVILIPNIKRSLAALGNLLSAVLSRDASVTVAASSRTDVVSCLCNLLIALLNSTLPLAPRHTILPHILGDLTMGIVQPVIRSFHTLSVHDFTGALEETSTSRKVAAPDIRPDLLATLRRLIECLRTLKARTRDLRQFMIFEAAKEVEALWNAERPAAVAGERSHAQRIENLARKDSLWYHCSILHAALDRFPLGGSRKCEVSLLSSEAVRVLVDLPRHFERGTPVDQIAKGMVLGVVEKAWLNGLYEQEQEDLE